MTLTSQNIFFKPLIDVIMRNGFEVNGDFRVMESAELVSILTNNSKQTLCVQEKEVAYNDDDFESVLAKMTPSKRTLVMAGVELYKRSLSQYNQKPILKSSEDVYDYMRPILGDNKTEECWAIFVNSKLRTIKRLRLAAGGYSDCLVDVRVLLKEAILCGACGFFFCHNHPSGSYSPSIQDNDMTQTIAKDARTLKLRMLDHVIICSDGFYSYADEGKI